MKSVKEQYIQDVKCIFPIRDRKVKQFIKRISESIDETSNDNMTYQDYVSQFGSPNEIVSTFYSEVEEDYLYKQMNRRRLFQICFSAMIIVLLLTAAVFHDKRIGYEQYYEENIVEHIYK